MSNLKKKGEAYCTSEKCQNDPVQPGQYKIKQNGRNSGAQIFLEANLLEVQQFD